MRSRRGPSSCSWPRSVVGGRSASDLVGGGEGRASDALAVSQLFCPIRSCEGARGDARVFVDEPELRLVLGAGLELAYDVRCGGIASDTARGEERGAYFSPK